MLHRTLVGVSASLALASVAMADPPEATLFWSVDGGLDQVQPLSGTPNQSGGATYVTSFNTDGGLCKLTLILNADFTADPQANINGQLKIENLSNGPRSVKFGVHLPICPAITSDPAFGVLSVMTLTTDGPGYLVCVEDGLINFTNGTQTVKSLFTCPYQLGTTGSGTMTSTAQFGTPGASAPTAIEFDELGVYSHCNISESDFVTYSFTFNAKDNDAWAPNPCPPDLTRDGIVNGQDLTLLLATWQDVSSCPQSLSGDVDQNGIVDATDLASVLSSWGSCGE
ncbi:MAG: hypothetical protein JNM94_09360 [Phycisphaerae bacterium]|nr:hypothetical protein [Phycisphaerae bacterium]